MGIAVTSLSFGWKYNWRLERLRESLQDTNPESPLFLRNESLPPGARPFNESMYGFKPWCVKEALDAGHKKIMFIDCTCIVKDKLDYYEQFAEEHGGVLAVQDDNKLSGFVARKARNYVNKGTDWFEDKHLVGGSLYYFDFNYEFCCRLWESWIQAEKDGMFGSMAEQCSERLQGHRSDETMMAIYLYLLGGKPFTGATRYNWEHGGVINKMHFK